MNNLKRVQKILKKYNQEHLLYFYDELDGNQKVLLLDQILSMNFEEILDLYNNSKVNSKLDINTLSPLPHFEKNKLSLRDSVNYISVGEDVIKSSNFAVVTMAGGQGTRLGYKGPKGTYELKFESSNTKKSLFQIMCEDIKRANDKY